mmetsp:Transcript_63795/g.195070  ORF Transcript_63795/g.195070 Transcript_63795/m.195070 type:complete len:294 (+) Transcript_63795:497-1378(+)
MPLLQPRGEALEDLHDGRARYVDDLPAAFAADGVQVGQRGMPLLDGLPQAGLAEVGRRADPPALHAADGQLRGAELGSRGPTQGVLRRPHPHPLAPPPLHPPGRVLLADVLSLQLDGGHEEDLRVEHVVARAPRAVARLVRAGRVLGGGALDHQAHLGGQVGLLHPRDVEAEWLVRSAAGVRGGRALWPRAVRPVEALVPGGGDLPGEQHVDLFVGLPHAEDVVPCVQEDALDLLAQVLDANGEVPHPPEERRRREDPAVNVVAQLRLQHWRQLVLDVLFVGVVALVGVPEEQ